MQVKIQNCAFSFIIAVMDKTGQAGGGNCSSGSHEFMITGTLTARAKQLKTWKKASDSARYKALGNSVAIPCVEFVLRGIAYFLRKTREERKV